MKVVPFLMRPNTAVVSIPLSWAWVAWFFTHRWRSCWAWGFDSCSDEAWVTSSPICCCQRERTTYHCYPRASRGTVTAFAAVGRRSRWQAWSSYCCNHHSTCSEPRHCCPLHYFVRLIFTDFFLFAVVFEADLEIAQLAADGKRFRLLMATIGQSVSIRSRSIPAVRITYLPACFSQPRWILRCSSSPQLGSIEKFYGVSSKGQKSALHSTRVLEGAIPNCRVPCDHHTRLLASGV